MNSTAKDRNRGPESFLQRIGLDLGHVPATATIGRLSRHINQKGYYFRTKMGWGSSSLTIDPQRAFQNWF